jgi:hypothetical protein
LDSLVTKGLAAYLIGRFATFIEAIVGFSVVQRLAQAEYRIADLTGDRSRLTAPTRR